MQLLIVCGLPVSRHLLSCQCRRRQRGSFSLLPLLVLAAVRSFHLIILVFFFVWEICMQGGAGAQGGWDKKKLMISKYRYLGEIYWQGEFLSSFPLVPTTHGQGLLIVLAVLLLLWWRTSDRMVKRWDEPSVSRRMWKGKGCKELEVVLYSFILDWLLPDQVESQGFKGKSFEYEILVFTRWGLSTGP